MLDLDFFSGDGACGSGVDQAAKEPCPASSSSSCNCSVTSH